MELKEESSSGDNIHQRVLVLRDVALGLNKSSEINCDLYPASYDCTVDSMLALHEECTQATSLNRNRNVGRFLRKCEHIVYIILRRLDRYNFSKPLATVC